MSEHTKLRVFNESIAIAGCRFTRNALTFELVEEAALVEAGAFLQAIDACSAWWWGDFLGAYCGFRLEKEVGGGKIDELTRVEKLRNYGAHYAAICGREPKTLWHWKSVSDFYESSRRREDLSWAHHVEAMQGADGDKAVADNWLDLAQRHNWSRSELRAAIRRNKRAESEPDEPLPQLVLPMELVHARRYAVTAIKRVNDMELEEAEAIVAETAPVVALATAAEQRVAELKVFLRAA